MRLLSQKALQTNCGLIECLLRMELMEKFTCAMTMTIKFRIRKFHQGYVENLKELSCFYGSSCYTYSLNS